MSTPGTPEKTLLVTGGAGFIGSALIRLLMQESDYRVVNVDALTYAGNPESLIMVTDDMRYAFHQADITDRAAMADLLHRYQPDAVVHLAAESHVDRSIDGPGVFIQTNIVGTAVLLDAALAYWRGLQGAARTDFRFLHISTDEVYGSLGPTGRFSETTPYDPRSPYSASKAASDHLVSAWHHTYGLPTLVTNCSNNYGPYQFPEKLIPLVISRALGGQPIPVYGTGSNVRDWLFVDDHARALRRVLEAGRPGETYNIGGGAERTNLTVVREICRMLDAMSPNAAVPDRASLITYVADRPGHDQRYAIDASKIERELGWTPSESFETGLARTVAWYLEHGEWVSRVQSGAYRGERLGLAHEGTV